MSHNAEPIIRKLGISDSGRALELSTEAGWNQTEEDWRLLIELAPNGCFGIEVDGELASTTTLVCYERRLAWVGMVLTKAKFRGRGFAKQLLTETLRLADALGIETVKLDATDQGRPLYEKLGFREEQTSERWVREPGLTATGTEPRATSLSEPSLLADTRAFGANRSELLFGLSRRGMVYADKSSYALTRPGRLKQYLGPCVAESPQTAGALIECAIQSAPERGWYWDLLAENTEAVGLSRDFGFSPSRRLLRMVRGKDLRGDEHRIYALAGFELG